MRMLLALLVACSTAGPPPPPTATEPVVTAHTTRIVGEDPESQAIAVAQAAWAATGPQTAPSAVVLAPQDALLALTAVRRLEGALLYQTLERGLSPRTRHELRRLHPTGRTQVYVIGRVQRRVLRTLRDDLGYTVRQFDEDDPVRLAAALDRWRGDRPERIVLCARDHWDGVARALEAGEDAGFAWVGRHDVPADTTALLARHPGATLVLAGDEEIISASVAEQLSPYGRVRRARTAPAGAFSVGDAGDLLGAIPAAVLPGPVVLVEDGLLPARLRGWLAGVPPGSHAWIVGPEAAVPWEVQRELERLLRPDAAPPTRVAEAP